MRLRPLIIALSLALLPGAAQPQEWGTAQRVDVHLSSFRFAPAELRLRAGQPVVLHLVNDAGGGHNFSAPEFFAAATVRPQDGAAARSGTVEVGGRASRDVALIPRAGRYRLRCTHSFHTALGMSGEIVVQ